MLLLIIIIIFRFLCRRLASLSTCADQWAGLNRRRCRSRCWSLSAEVLFTYTVTQ